MSGSAQPQILVIDDEADVLTVIRMTLEKEGFQVHTAGTVAAGLEFFARHSAEMRLVLLDYLWPEMTGDRVFERLQQLDPGVRVVLLTGCDFEVARKLLARGVRGYLQKPFMIEDLISCVRDEVDARPAAKDRP